MERNIAELHRDYVAAREQYRVSLLALQHGIAEVQYDLGEELRQIGAPEEKSKTEQAQTSPVPELAQQKPSKKPAQQYLDVKAHILHELKRLAAGSESRSARARKVATGPIATQAFHDLTKEGKIVLVRNGPQPRYYLKSEPEGGVE